MNRLEDFRYQFYDEFGSGFEDLIVVNEISVGLSMMLAFGIGLFFLLRKPLLDFLKISAIKILVASLVIFILAEVFTFLPLLAESGIPVGIIFYVLLIPAIDVLYYSPIAYGSFQLVPAELRSIGFGLYGALFLMPNTIESMAGNFFDIYENDTISSYLTWVVGLSCIAIATVFLLQFKGRNSRP